jgi:hypothetical protein
VRSLQDYGPTTEFGRRPADVVVHNHHHERATHDEYHAFGDRRKHNFGGALPDLDDGHASDHHHHQSPTVPADPAALCGTPLGESVAVEPLTDRRTTAAHLLDQPPKTGTAELSTTAASPIATARCRDVVAGRTPEKQLRAAPAALYPAPG